MLGCCSFYDDDSRYSRVESSYSGNNQASKSKGRYSVISTGQPNYRKTETSFEWPVQSSHGQPDLATSSQKPSQVASQKFPFQVTIPQQLPQEPLQNSSPKSSSNDLLSTLFSPCTEMADAMFYIGEDYAEKGNHQRAFECYQSAAEGGHGEAQYKLGRIYLVGEIVPRDRDQACKWLQLAADQKVPMAQRYLEAAKGETNALFRLGERYTEDKEHQQAFECYQAAAEAGHGEAQCKLGRIYLVGEIVSQDRNQACKWLQLAADQKVRMAQSWLAVAKGETNVLHFTFD